CICICISAYSSRSTRQAFIEPVNVPNKPINKKAASIFILAALFSYLLLVAVTPSGKRMTANITG
ncbi:hypothetical protein AB4200_18735, partial [Vibrio kanaloae]|uniref:hypothetical protein n=1 Tax=Vibrio kanaloae TaxID=170673 RepID=UPI00354E5804